MLLRFYMRKLRMPAISGLIPASAVTLLLLLTAPSPLTAYDYPVINPYAATIVGTPTALKARAPEKIREKEMLIPPLKGREIPDVFWYQHGMKYSLAYQKEKAPLIFIIAGTGANYKSSTMDGLKRSFYNAGFHVVSLTSPTYMDFIVNRSTSGMPGVMREDAEDIYSAMKLVWSQIQQIVGVSDFYLAGYSLGGAHSAFIARLDDEVRFFNFKKVLMINPPVNLYSSMKLIDSMLADNLHEGLENLDNYFESTMKKFSRIYQQSNNLAMNSDFIYSLYREMKPDDREMQSLIGISFRFFAANMIFTADVMNNAGYIVPEGKKLSSTSSTTDYFKVATQINFSDYVDELFYPFFKKRHPEITKEKLIQDQSLESIREYLASTDKIGVFTNADDPILDRQALDFLITVFGKRARIYPHGGHIGNIDYNENVSDMIAFFVEGGGK